MGGKELKSGWRWIILGAVTLLLVFFFLFAWVKTSEFGSDLQFEVVDAVSESWVHNVRIEIQDRFYLGFYQNQFRFTNLETGVYELTVRAPHYESYTTEVELERGAQALSNTIMLQGKTIPDLSYFYAFEEKQGGDYTVELRPADREGKGIVFHPCLDIRVGCRIYESIPEPGEGTSSRGRVLFSEYIPWTWNDRFGEAYRYHAKIDTSKIEQSDAEEWIIDYLVIVPKPGEISSRELNKLAASTATLEDDQELLEVLDDYASELDYYFDTSYSVDSLE
jgi:hypothetical protein